MTSCFVRYAKKGDEELKKKKKIYLQRFDTKKNKLVNERQVIWGDYLRIDENYDTSSFGEDILCVIWSPNRNSQRLFIHKDYTTVERPLEIIFLDVGQGDGAILISPENGKEGKIMVVDAGERDNMYNFLRARFAPYHNFKFHSAIITHPDMDHYLGFERIFEDQKLGFKHIYQNGLVERPVSGQFEKVGGFEKDEDNNEDYIYNIAENRSQIEAIFSDNSNFGKFVFPRIMYNALNNPNIDDFHILSTHRNHSVQSDGRNYMPDFSPTDNPKYSIEVLGPIMEEDKDGRLRLRKISSAYGKTKNGHSIILRLHFGKYKILFGGDLNTIAEKFLLQEYTKRNKFPRKGTQDSINMIAEARNWFGADIMKVCHHGASDVTDEFISVVNPACYIISSGDQEGHVHPKPDLLGRLGKLGRGESPVLLATELQRSTREYEDKKKTKALNRQIDKISIEGDLGKRKILKQVIKDSIKELSRKNVDTYGAIYLKTDGDRLITAFKIEEGSSKKKWYYFEYGMDDATGEIQLVK